ncbi:hypothetical protein [Microtetraspora malaysiensis]|uniref:hypothetical protein n=1 Tax=Microtetraspora malaysiensis TaxID=161358 RepID=UPI003D8D803F
MGAIDIQLRPVAEDDLAMFRRFATEPGLIGLDWTGFRDAQDPARRYATDGYLGEDHSRIIVEVDGTAAGFMSWSKQGFGVSRYWEIGIALLPDWRGARHRLARSGDAVRLPAPTRRSSASRRPPTPRTSPNRSRW